jgi:hypothetical protein
VSASVEDRTAASGQTGAEPQTVGTVRLADDQLAALAEMTAARLAEMIEQRESERESVERERVLRENASEPAAGLVSAVELARRLGVSRAYVYAHSRELGGVQLGSGRRARLRFDVQTARSALAGFGGGRDRVGGEQSQPRIPSAGAESKRSTPRNGRPLAQRRPKVGGVLADRSGERAA